MGAIANRIAAAMGRAVGIFFGPGVDKLLDMRNVCRCITCCTVVGGFQPCNNKADEGERYCNWCKGAQARKYTHCHGQGNSMLKAGWRLEGTERPIKP